MSAIKYSAVRVNGLVNAGAAFINAEGMAALKAKREAMEVLTTCKVATFKALKLHECGGQAEANSRLEAAGVEFFKVGKMKSTLADYASRFKSEAEIAVIKAAKREAAKLKAAAKKAEKAAAVNAAAIESLNVPMQKAA